MRQPVVPEVQYGEEGEMNRSYVWMIALCLGACAPAALSQGQPGGLQKEIRQIRDAMAGNRQRLHGYQWIETVTIAIDGTPRTPRRSLCRYGADGKLQKTALDQQPGRSEGRSGAMPLRGGGLIRMALAKRKKDKYRKEIKEISALRRLYMPIDPAKLRAASQTGQIAIHNSGPSEDAIVIDNYAKQGDQFRITVNRSPMQIEAIRVKSWLKKPKDSVTSVVTFGRLPDGTMYPAVTSVKAPSEKFSITIVDSDFSRAVD